MATAALQDDPALQNGTRDGEVRFQIMLDLHLETPRMRPLYSQFSIEPRCDNLVLLGDIGYVADDELFDFLERQLQIFKVVIYVFGNHEPYGMDYASAISKMTGFEESVRQRTSGGRFVFLDRRRVDIGNVTILGCTLHSKIAESQQRSVALFLSDFWNITSWTVEDHNAAHEVDVAWLNDQVSRIAIEDPRRRVVVLTHHSPTSLPEANDPEHLEDSRGVQSAFVTDLGDQPCWTNSQVGLWAFGHTHFNCDFMEMAKRVVANQRGYGHEDRYDFDEEKVIAI